MQEVLWGDVGCNVDKLFNCANPPNMAKMFILEYVPFCVYDEQCRIGYQNVGNRNVSHSAIRAYGQVANITIPYMSYL